MTAKTVVYDGDCPLCVATSRAMVRRGWIDEAHRRAFQSHEGAAAARLLEAGLRDGVGVVDEASGEIRTGFEGLRFLFEGARAPWWFRVASSPPLRPVSRLLYALVAANRRALAPPPRREVPCACDPTPEPALETLFALLCLAAFAAVACAEAFGLARRDEARSIAVARLVLGAEVVPWLLQAAFASTRRGGGLRRYASFAWSAAVSSLWMLPALALLPWLRDAGASIASSLALVARWWTLRGMESRRRPPTRGWRALESWSLEVGAASIGIAARGAILGRL